MNKEQRSSVKAIKAIYEPDAAATRLIQLDVPAPAVGGRDLLVQVKAVAANPVDYKVRDGLSVCDKKEFLAGMQPALCIPLEPM